MALPSAFLSRGLFNLSVAFFLSCARFAHGLGRHRLAGLGTKLGDKLGDRQHANPRCNL
jgi:hypothetical protein